MGLFDKKTPTPTDTTNTSGSVSGVSGIPVAGTTTQSVAQSPVVPSVTADVTVPEPLVSETSVGTGSVAGGGLVDDSIQATVPTAVASEEPTVSTDMSEAAIPPVVEPMDSTPPSIGRVPAPDSSSVSNEEPQVSVPDVPTFGQPAAVVEPDDTEDTSGTGSAGSGLAG